VKTKIPAYVNDDKEKKGQSYFLQFYLDFFSSLLHSSESNAAGGPAESGRADVAAGSHQTSELVSYLGLSGLNLNRKRGLKVHKHEIFFLTFFAETETL
jgi:hypothetical protein